MRNALLAGQKVSDSDDEDFNPSYCSIRRKDTRSKKELRRACFNKQELQNTEVYPEPDYDMSYRNIMM